MTRIEVLTPGNNLNYKQSSQFRDEIIDIYLKKPDILILDLQNVQFMDAAGLGALFTARRLARESNTRFIICSLTEQVYFLFQATLVFRYFEILFNRVEATEAIWADFSAYHIPTVIAATIPIHADAANYFAA